MIWDLSARIPSVVDSTVIRRPTLTARYRSDMSPYRNMGLNRWALEHHSRSDRILHTHTLPARMVTISVARVFLACKE